MGARVHPRVFWVSVLALVALGLSSAPAQLPGPAQAPTFRVGNAPKYAPGEVLVRFRPSTAKAGRAAVHALVRGQVVRSFRVVRDLELVRLPEAVSVEEAVSLYRKDPNVLYAEPNYTWRIDLAPNDPRFPELWGLHNTGQSGGTPDADIDAPEAWDITTGDPNVVVGVIDTGIDYTHEDLAANMFQNALDCNSNGIDDDGNGFIDDCFGIDTFNNDSDPMDDHGHGTHVSGTIGAMGNNGVGVVGVNWNVRLIACKVLGTSGGFTSGAVACLEYLATMKDRGVNLVATNNSWGGGSFSQALLDAIDAHRQRDILFIAAAGNANSNNDVAASYPNGFYLPNVIAVAATDHTDALAGFSNFGRRSVHLGAPGVRVFSTLPGNGYAAFSGTSMAAPHVTGVAALLAAQGPLRDWKAIKNLILAGGDTVAATTDTISQKRLNARGAMTCSNSTLLSVLQPRHPTTTAGVGFPLDLAVLHINCAIPNGNVTVSVDGGVEVITLLDDGLGTDQEAGDGIYSGQWIPSPSVALGAHSLAFPGGDVVTVQVLSPYRFYTTAFGYRNIAGTPIVLGEDSSALLTLPFPIPFGGGSFESLFVNSNGNITFTAPFPNPVNGPIPTATTPTLVAPFWDDLLFFGTSNVDPEPRVLWEVAGTAPNRELVIEWRGADRGDTFCPDSRITFQVVFFEARSDILFNYADVSFSPGCGFGDRGVSATVGIQVSPRLGTQFSFDTGSLSDGLTLLWELGHPAPTPTRLSPFTAIAGDPDFTLTVLGSNFVPSSVVRWNGADRQTSFVSSGELRADISAADIAAPATAQVSVSNPAPGGGVSSQLPFAIYASHPLPVLNSVSRHNRGEPFVGRAGEPGLTLTVRGSKFVTRSVVRWNGSDRPTTVLNSTAAEVQIPESDLAVAGTAEVTVFNPAPGGGTSNALTIQIDNPIPANLGGARFVRAGGPDFTFRLSGWGFVSVSVVRWNGQDRPTTFVSRDEIRATIFASDVAVPGFAEVTVFNPPPGGGLSEAKPVEIVAPPPNDDFASAIDINLFAPSQSMSFSPLSHTQPLPFTHTVDARVASTEAGDPIPSCSDVNLDGIGVAKETLWYKYTALRDVPLFGRASGFRIGWSKVLSVWTGAPGSFTEVACGSGWWQDDVVGPTVVFGATAGTTYYLMASIMEGWSGGEPSATFFLDEDNPAPTLTALSPTSVEAGGSDFTLTVDGSGFVPGSAVEWRGPAQAAFTVKPTTFVSDTRLTAAISASDIATAGAADVAAGNPSRGSHALSNPLPLSISGNHPLPTLSALVPDHVPPQTGGDLTLTVNGGDFLRVSVVRWNGQDRTTNFVSATQLTAAILASDIATAGTAQVTVFNPAPGGGSSDALIFTIGNPLPTLSSLLPTSTEAGGPGPLLIVNGSGFVSSSVVRWNGADRGTAFVSASQLQAAILASDVASPGSHQITVFNPSPGGGTSAAVNFASTGFGIGLSPSTASVARGQAASFTATVSPQFGPFGRAVNLTCSVAPAGPTCSLGNASLTPGANPATTTLTVNTGSSASLRVPQQAPLWALWMALPGLALLGVGLRSVSGRRKKLGLWVSLGLVAAVLALQVACGGGGQQSQSRQQVYTITVSGTSGSLQAQASASLTVQQ